MQYINVIQLIQRLNTTNVDKLTMRFVVVYSSIAGDFNNSIRSNIINNSGENSTIEWRQQLLFKDRGIIDTLFHYG